MGGGIWLKPGDESKKDLQRRATGLLFRKAARRLSLVSDETDLYQQEPGQSEIKPVNKRTSKGLVLRKSEMRLEPKLHRVGHRTDIVYAMDERSM
jgi:hypothetical protein